MIDLLTTPEEQEIADTVSRMLAENYPVNRFRIPAQERPATDANIVAHLAKLGAPGLGVSEAAGGLGLGCAIEALVFREYGRFLASPRVLGTILAARMAATSGATASVAEFIAGEVTAGVGIAAKMGNRGTLLGEVQIFDAGPRHQFVLWEERGAGLYDATGLDRRPVKGLDETLTMEIAETKGLEPLIWIEASTEPLPLLGDLFSAAMMVGMCEAVRDMAVEYAKTREQFGQPIGHFQAVKHKCADMALHVEAAWCETVYAALELEQSAPSAQFHVLNSKLLAARALLNAAKDNIQVHGGMGYTTEVSAHHFMKRGRVMSEIGGGPRKLQARLLALPIAS